MYVELAMLISALVASVVIGERFLAFEEWLERRDYNKHFND